MCVFGGFVWGFVLYLLDLWGPGSFGKFLRDFLKVGIRERLLSASPLPISLLLSVSFLSFPPL